MEADKYVGDTMKEFAKDVRMMNDPFGADEFNDGDDKVGNNDMYKIAGAEEGKPLGKMAQGAFLWN